MLCLWINIFHLSLKLVSYNSVNFAIFEVLSLNLLQLHFQMRLYIPALISVIAFYMIFQSIPYIACKIKNFVACIVTRTSRSLYISLILKSLHWLHVKYSINFKLCCITHCALSLREPHYL